MVFIFSLRFFAKFNLLFKCSSNFNYTLIILFMYLCYSCNISCSISYKEFILWFFSGFTVLHFVALNTIYHFRTTDMQWIYLLGGGLHLMHVLFPYSSPNNFVIRSMSSGKSLIKYETQYTSCRTPPFTCFHDYVIP